MDANKLIERLRAAEWEGEAVDARRLCVEAADWIEQNAAAVQSSTAKGLGCAFNESVGQGEIAPAAEPHPHTEECGYDRQSSIQEDQYVCMCGWRSHELSAPVAVGDFTAHGTFRAAPLAMPEEPVRYIWGTRGMIPTEKTSGGWITGILYDELRSTLKAALERIERMNKLATPAEFTVEENARLRKRLEQAERRAAENEKDAQRYRVARLLDDYRSLEQFDKDCDATLERQKL